MLEGLGPFDGRVLSGNSAIFLLSDRRGSCQGILNHGGIDLLSLSTFD